MRNLKSIAMMLAVTFIVTLGIATRSDAVIPRLSHSPHMSVPGGKVAPNEMTEDEQLAGIAQWVLIIFVVFALAVYFAYWRPMVSKGLKSRHDRIASDLASAQQQLQAARQALKAQNEQLAGAQSRMQEMLAKAKLDGQNLAANIRTQAEQEAEQAKDRAARDIETSKNAAIREVYETTASISTEIAEKILRRSLNADDQREMVRQSLEQLQTIK